MTRLDSNGVSWIIIDLPVSYVAPKHLTEGQKARQKAHEKKFENGTYFTLGNGCRDFPDCLKCPIDIDSEGCHYGREEKE